MASTNEDLRNGCRATQRPQSTLSDTLRATAHAIEESHISLRQMLALVGEQGMLLFCVLLTVPFLLPVSIPGVSTPLAC